MAGSMRVVFVIDTSVSMNQRSKSGISLLDGAKRSRSVRSARSLPCPLPCPCVRVISSCTQRC